MEKKNPLHFYEVREERQKSFFLVQGNGKEMLVSVIQS